MYSLPLEHLHTLLLELLSTSRRSILRRATPAAPTIRTQSILLIAVTEMTGLFGRDEFYIQHPSGMGPRSRQGARDAELPDLHYATLRTRSRGLYTEPGQSQCSAELSNHGVPGLVDDLESRLAGLNLVDNALYTSHARLVRMSNRAPHRTASSQFPRHPDGYNIRAGPDNLFRGYGSGRYDRGGYGSGEYCSEEYGHRRLGGEYSGAAISQRRYQEHCEYSDRPRRHHHHHHEGPRLNHRSRHCAYGERGVDERWSCTEYPPGSRRSRPGSPIRPYEVEEVE
jgi:hypothetical protein